MKTNLVCMVLSLAWFAQCGLYSNDYLFEEGVVSLQGRILDQGQPVAGAKVFFVGKPDDIKTTNEEGRFVLLSEVGRNQTVVATLNYELIDGASGVQVVFDIPNSGSRDIGNLALKPLGEVIGTVELLQPTEVTVYAAETWFQTKPNADGSYRLPLPPGNWNLGFFANGYSPKTIPGVVVSSGQSSPLPAIQLSKLPIGPCTGSRLVTESFSQGGGKGWDFLLIIDNSGSMVGEQLNLTQSVRSFAQLLQTKEIDYHMAVITPGEESPGCPACSKTINSSCMNWTGESGRFQDRLGKIIDPNTSPPTFSFRDDSTCRVLTPSNFERCFFNPATSEGTALVGVTGCGYERGLSAMRKALSEPLKSSWNAGFLRPDANLAVILISDEEDCGEVGDVKENTTAGGKICYYAAKGQAPDGTKNDPNGKPYALTKVSEYADFLKKLKGSSGQAVFSAVVGVRDPENPGSTQIEFSSNSPTADAVFACTTPSCTGENCAAFPGTRYIQLAQLTGGRVETLCQSDYSQIFQDQFGEIVAYRTSFRLKNSVVDNYLSVTVNGQKIFSGYSYDPNTNTLVFEPAKAPPPYASILVQYNAACD